MNEAPQSRPRVEGQNYCPEINIAADHPAFAGHFPGRPIIPGVVLLDQVLIAIGQWLNPALEDDRELLGCEISTAKFFSPVVPGEALKLHAAPQPCDGVDAIRFEISAGSRKIANGTIKYHRQPTT